MIEAIDTILSLIVMTIQFFMGMVALLVAIYLACLFLSFMPFVIFGLCCIAAFKGVLK